MALCRVGSGLIEPCGNMDPHERTEPRNLSPRDPNRCKLLQERLVFRQPKGKHVRDPKMEKLKRLATRIAYTPDANVSSLSYLQRSLIPLLSVASVFYHFSLIARQQLYSRGFFSQTKLPVSVISVGNITWGGNGKTPMVEFIARRLIEDGICPLILTRGYGGGDEAKMLERHFAETCVKIGVGADRVGTASCFFCKYGHVDVPSTSSNWQKDVRGRIGAVILDDGLQHIKLVRDFNVVMINGLMPWGNEHLIPRGPLREPLNALKRAHAAVIHNTDLVSDMQLERIILQIREIEETLPIFFSRLAPLHFFHIQEPSCPLPLNAVEDVSVVCISAIGFADSFVQTIETLGASCVDRMDFTDHHFFTDKDILLINEKIEELKHKFCVLLVVVTEKDYDRDQTTLMKINHGNVVVLCSSLSIMRHSGQSEESFVNILRRCIQAPA